MSEFGIVLPLKAGARRCANWRICRAGPTRVIGDLLGEVSRLDERIHQYDRHIQAIAKDSTPARQLMQLPGVGPPTATALVAMIGRGQEFRCGRQLSAWVGLVPGQYSSGGKQRLGRITKAGDPYLLRMLLILGARAVLSSAKDTSDATSRWAVQLAARVGYWKAAVAIAARNARMCWAVLARGESFKLPAWPVPTADRTIRESLFLDQPPQCLPQRLCLSMQTTGLERAVEKPVVERPGGAAPEIVRAV